MLKVKISIKVAILSAVLSIAGVMNAEASSMLSDDMNRLLEDRDAAKRPQPLSTKKIQEIIKNNPEEVFIHKVACPQLSSVKEVLEILQSKEKALDTNDLKWVFAPRYSTYFDKLIQLDPSKYTIQVTSPSTVAVYDPDLSRATLLPMYAVYEILPRTNLAQVELPTQSDGASNIITMQATNEEAFDLKFVLKRVGD